MSEPTKTPSDEVDQRQLDLADRAGDAYQEAVDYMAEEVANVGEKRRVGDYVVGFAQEEAEGLYALTDDGEFEWREPAEGENCHLEVVVADAADGRFLPHVDVEVILRGEGDEVGPVEVPFLWHPGLYHYGTNLELPGDGQYDVEIRAEPPTFHRHDEQNGDRYGEGFEETFESVSVETGQD